SEMCIRDRSWVDVLTFAGSFGLFLTLFLLFVRYLPMVAMAEIKTVMPQAKVRHRVGTGDYRGDIPGRHGVGPDVSRCRALLEAGEK
ncbi:MAG: hypothetical protein QUU85_03660, partial [Candidatus Eisenbacteria bacterium]|nr:hypothetical protein [Candidatus Eisenbacteria bacterium]